MTPKRVTIDFEHAGVGFLRTAYPQSDVDPVWKYDRSKVSVLPETGGPVSKWHLTEQEQRLLEARFQHSLER